MRYEWHHTRGEGFDAFDETLDHPVERNGDWRQSPRPGNRADASSGMLDVLRGKVRAQGLANVETILLDPQQPLSLSARFGVTTATITRKENRDYPVFLITGRRPG